MPTLLRDRNEVLVAVAVLGTALGALNLALSSGWGWILALLTLPALAIRAVWRSMPGWLLLTVVTVPSMIGNGLGVTESAYLVTVAAATVVAAYEPRPIDLVALAACALSPFVPWAMDLSGWHGALDSWVWSGGLVLGSVFGFALGEQWKLIEELERTRTKLAEVAVTDERHRIARELHDLVGHSFSVVLLHLSGARMLLDTAPDEAAAALRDAEEVGRTGMEELRQALLLLRDGTERADPVAAIDLFRLVDGYREAGMDLTLEVVGEVHAVSAGPGIVLHDVIREALTNVAKHASSPIASVQVIADGAEATVQVASPIRAGAIREGSGVGLAGLEHRVTAIGGTFEAGPVGERWVVDASVPSRLARISA
jgi:signal transduction histidine kinase